MRLSEGSWPKEKPQGWFFPRHTLPLPHHNLYQTVFYSMGESSCLLTNPATNFLFPVCVALSGPISLTPKPGPWAPSHGSSRLGIRLVTTDVQPMPRSRWSHVPAKALAARRQAPSKYAHPGSRCQPSVPRHLV